MLILKNQYVVMKKAFEQGISMYEPSEEDEPSKHVYYLVPEPEQDSAMYL